MDLDDKHARSCCWGKENQCSRSRVWHDPKRNYVPSTIEESFYTGQVFVGPTCLLVLNSNHPVLVIYTDGGPDHNVPRLPFK